MKKSVLMRCTFSEKAAYPTFSERFNDLVWCDHCGEYFRVSENETVTITKDAEGCDLKARSFRYPVHGSNREIEKRP